MQFLTWLIIGAQDIHSDSLYETYKWGNLLTNARYSPDGTIIACSTRKEKKVVFLLDALSGDSISTIQTEMHCTVSDFSPSGRYLIVTDLDNNVRLIAMLPEVKDKIFTGHSANINSIDCSFDGTKIVTAGSDGSAKVWNTQTGEFIGGIPSDSGYTFCADYSDDGTKIVTSSSYGYVRIWDSGTFHLMRNLSGAVSDIRKVCFSPNGRRVGAGASDGTIYIWDVETGELDTLFKKDSNALFSLRFSPDGNVLMGTGWGIWLYDCDSGEELWSRPGVQHTRCVADFSPDGKTVAVSGSNKGIQICSVTNGDTLKEIQDCASLDFAFTPNGKYLFVGGGGVCFLYDLTTGLAVKCYKRLVTYTTGYGCVAVSPNGAQLFTAMGGNVQIWNGDEFNAVNGSRSGFSAIPQVCFFDNTTRSLQFHVSGQLKNAPLLFQVFQLSGKKITEISLSPDNRPSLIRIPLRLPQGFYLYRVSAWPGSENAAEGTFIVKR